MAAAAAPATDEMSLGETQDDICLQTHLLKKVLHRGVELYTFKPLVWRLHEVSPGTPQPKGDETDVVPYPRSGHRIVYHNHNLYSYGGFNNASDEPHMFKELWRYNTSRRQWCRVKMSGCTSPNVASMAAVVVNDNAAGTSTGARMLVYGGTRVPFGSALTNRIYLVDLRTGEFSHFKTALDGDGDDGSDDDGNGPAGRPGANGGLMGILQGLGGHLGIANHPILGQLLPEIFPNPDHPPGDDHDDDEEDWEDVEEEEEEEIGDHGEDQDEDDMWDIHIPNGELDEDLPVPAYGQALALVDDETDGPVLYSVGGTNGVAFYSDVHRFVFKDRAWSKCYLTGFNNGPEPRYRHELAYWNKKIFLLGGGTSFSSYGFIELWYFDLTIPGQFGRGEWRKAATLPDPTCPIDESGSEQFPAPRRCHDCIQRGKYVYVYGGFDGSQILGDFWQLDLEHLQWTQMSCKQLLPSYFSSSAVTQAGQIFTFGGVCSMDQKTRTNKLHSMWLEVPSLRDMAWEALLHYLPDVGDLPSRSLVLGGVPNDLVKSLL